MQKQDMPDLKEEIKDFLDYLIIVEGKKDASALESLGFTDIFVLNKSGKSIGEKIEEIESISAGKKICILTDFDKKGKQLFLLLKKELSQRNIRMDNSLRKIIRNTGAGYIEDLKIESR